MNREKFKEIREQAKERFKEYTTMENLFYISELLDLESQKYETEKNTTLSIQLGRYSLYIANLIDLVIKDLEKESDK